MTVSENLVNRLRDHQVCSIIHNYCRNDWVCEEAANYIENVEKDKKFIIEERDRTFAHMLNRATKAEENLDESITALIRANSWLVGSISLLKNGGKQNAPSDKMFEQMLIDYENGLEYISNMIRSLENSKKDAFL